ncbi:MAG: choice-of-anchor D domain-containing protein, partial [Bacteroidota bacterium]
ETKTSYAIRVQADDGSGGLFAKAFTVNVTNVIEYPEIVVEQPAATDLTSGTASVSFGYEPLGTPGVVKTFTIRNTGLAPLTLSNPTVSGGNASDFTVNTTGLLLTVPPGGQTTFVVNFTPSASGSRSTTLSIGNNDTDESPFTITLTGNGAGSLPTGPEIGIELGGIDLSSQVVAWGRYNTTPADLTNARMVSGGGEHSLALKSDGTVVAWGRNTEGQATVPAGLSGVMAVAAGAYHSLALKADGTVVMWGDDNHGAYAVPAGLTNVKQIATGYDHSLALKQDGTVVAWGYNFDGQATVPSGLSNVIAIAAGSSHSLALKSDGTVVGWGTPTGGQSTPPAGLTGVVAIAAGVHHSLALKSDGTVVAWG